MEILAKLESENSWTLKTVANNLVRPANYRFQMLGHI